MKKRCSNLPSAPHGGSGSALYRAETKGVGQHPRILFNEGGGSTFPILLSLSAALGGSQCALPQLQERGIAKGIALRHPLVEAGDPGAGVAFAPVIDRILAEEP